MSLISHFRTLFHSNHTHALDLYYKFVFNQRKQDNRMQLSCLAQYYLFKPSSAKRFALEQMIFAFLFYLRNNNQTERALLIEKLLRKLGFAVTSPELPNDKTDDHELDQNLAGVLIILFSCANIEPAQTQEFKFDLCDSNLFPQLSGNEYMKSTHRTLFGALKHPSVDSGKLDVSLSIPRLPSQPPDIVSCLISQNEATFVNVPESDSGYESPEDEWLSISRLDFESLIKPLNSWEALQNEPICKQRFITYFPECFDEMYKR